jgi:hypothetical protein
MKLPKIQKACDPSNVLRPVMQHVYVDSNNIVASDSKILVIHPRTMLEHIDDLPEKFFIPHYSFDPLTKEHLHARYIKEASVIEVLYKNNRKGYVEIKIEPGFAYPDYTKVLPSKDKEENVGMIGINPRLVCSLAESMGITYQGLAFKFHGENRAILVKDKSGEMHESIGLITPIKIDREIF